jgi:hypothetical protein
MKPWHYYRTDIEATDEENLVYTHYHTDALEVDGLRFLGTFLGTERLEPSV